MEKDLKEKYVKLFEKITLASKLLSQKIRSMEYSNIRNKILDT